MVDFSEKSNPILAIANAYAIDPAHLYNFADFVMRVEQVGRGECESISSTPHHQAAIDFVEANVAVAVVKEIDKVIIRRWK